MTSERLALVTLALGLGLGSLVGAFVGPVLGLRSSGASSSGGRAVEPALDLDSRARELQTAATAGSTVAQLASVAQPAGDPRADVRGDAEALLASSAAARAATAALRTAASDGAAGTEGVGHISGLVVDEVGQPLAGVTLVSELAQGSGPRAIQGAATEGVGRAWQGLRDLDEALEPSARHELARRESLRTTVTDAAGRFRLEDLRPGQHTVSAYIEGLVFAHQSLYTGDSAHFVGRKVCEFHLDVRLPDGSAPREAVVMLGEEHRWNTSSYRWTPEEPVLRLGEQAAQLQVYAGDVSTSDYRTYDSAYAAPSRTIDLGRDGSGPHTFQLQARARLEVRVADRSSREPRIAPWVKAVSADGPGAQTGVQAFKAGQRLIRMDAERFSAVDLTPGAWVVGAGRGSDEPEVTARVEIGPGPTEVSLELGELDLSRFLVVRCKGPEGAPLFGVTFGYSIAHPGGGGRSGGVTSFARPGGEYWIGWSELLGGRERGAEIKARLTSTARGYGKLESELTPNQRELDLVFEPACDLDVFVTGDLSPGYLIQLEPAGSEGRGLGSEVLFIGRNGQPTGRIDGQGRASIAGLQPGPYRVLLVQSKQDLPVRAPTVASAEVTLRPGSQAVTLVAPQLYELVVYAPDIAVGTTFLLMFGGEVNSPQTQRQVDLGADRRARFAHVPAGEYTVAALGQNGGRSLQVVVPSGEVQFQTEVLNALRVKDVVADKLAAQAGLRDGDLVLSVGGREVDGHVALQRIFLGIQGGTVVLRVQRGGALMDVTLGPATTAQPWVEIGASFAVTSR